MLRYYYMDISCGCSYEQSQLLCRMLPKDRIEKKDRMRNYNMAQRSLLTSSFMQYGISDALGIPMDTIEYCYGQQGKPFLAEKTTNYLIEQGKEAEVHFNLSHSGNYVVLVVSDKPVGIDVECRKRNHLKVAKRCFCFEEYEDIKNAGTEEEQDKRFLQYWTMKEAFIKRDGRGMSIPLNSFCIVRKEHDYSYVKLEDTTYFTTFFQEEFCCVSICGEDLESIEKYSVCMEDIIKQSGV